MYKDTSVFSSLCVFLGSNQTVGKKKTVIKTLALQFYLQPALWNSLRRREERKDEERSGEERRGMGEVHGEKGGRKEERTLRCWKFRLLQLHPAHPHCTPETHTWTHNSISTKMHEEDIHAYTISTVNIHVDKLAAYSRVKWHEASVHVLTDTQKHSMHIYDP